MRSKLKILNTQRLKFFAVVASFGTKKNYHSFPTNTICLQNVTNQNGVVLTDHLWFSVGKTIDALKLQVGDKISFEARVSSYTKGYVNHREFINNQTVDYKLSNPTKFLKL